MLKTCFVFYLVISLLLPQITSGNSAAHSVWDYLKGEFTPGKWGGIYPLCDGKQQSPIEIWRDDVIINISLPLLHLRNYHRKVHSAQIENNVKITMPEGHDATIDGGGLPGSYRLQQLHFHWGDTDFDGSEHKIGGEAFPFEMHMVHKLHSKESQQFQYAVVAVQFQITPTDNEDLNSVVRELKHLRFKGTTKVIDHDITPVLFLPIPANSQSIYNFYTYNGSFTTPPCTESVKWLVLADFGTISRFQLNHFRQVYKSESKEKVRSRMSKTYRPVQHMNNRKIIGRTATYLPKKQTFSRDNSARKNWSMSTITMLCLLGACLVFS